MYQRNLLKGDGIKTKTHSLIFFASIAVSLFVFLGWLAFGLIQSRSHVPDAGSANMGVPTAGLGCGQAALMTVARVHSKKTESKLRSLLTENQEPQKAVTSFYDLANWARAVGMSPTGFKVDSRHLAKLPLPAIAHLNQNHFVALMTVDSQEVGVIDMGISQCEIVRADFEKQFSGYVLCF